jgi:AraC-like DNA-binding protein
MRAIEQTSGTDPVLGSYRFARALPARHLRGFVREYSGYVDQAHGIVRRRELPIADTVVLINLGARWNMLDPRSTQLVACHGSFAAGLSEQYAVVEGTGSAHCFHMNLTALGAYRFFGVPMHQLSDRIFELDDVLDSSLSELRERLFDASWADAFTLLDNFLSRRIEGTRAVSREIAWAIAELERTHGLVRIGQLSDELGCSRKHLRERFLEQVGAPAKQLAQLLRFNHLLERMQSLPVGDPGRQLAALASACGFADQAHLTREFRRYSGWTPTEYLKQQTLVADGVIVAGE